MVCNDDCSSSLNGKFKYVVSNHVCYVIKSRFLSRVLHCFFSTVDAEKFGQLLQDGPRFFSFPSFQSTVSQVKRLAGNGT